MSICKYSKQISRREQIQQYIKTIQIGGRDKKQRQCLLTATGKVKHVG